MKTGTQGEERRSFLLLHKKSMASVKHETEMKNLQSNNGHMKYIP